MNNKSRSKSRRTKQQWQKRERDTLSAYSLLPYEVVIARIKGTRKKKKTTLYSNLNSQTTSLCEWEETVINAVAATLSAAPSSMELLLGYLNDLGKKLWSKKVKKKVKIMVRTKKKK